VMINNDNWCFLPNGLQQELQDYGFGFYHKTKIYGELKMGYNPEGDITPFEDYEWGYSAFLKNGSDWIKTAGIWSGLYDDDHDLLDEEESVKKFQDLAYDLLTKFLKTKNLSATPQALNLIDFSFDYQGDWSEDVPNMEEYWLKKIIGWRFEINPLCIK